MKADALVKTVIAMVPHAARSEAGKLVPKKSLEKLSFFKKMKPADQVALLEDTRDFLGASLMEGVSRLARGMHLARIQELLTPYGAYQKFLRNFRISIKTSYRYVNGFKNAQKHWPGPILTAAIARGMDITSSSEDRPLGQYTEAVRILPPPTRTVDADGANRYLDQLEQTHKERRKRMRKRDSKAGAGKKQAAAEIVVGDPQTMLKQAYRTTSILMRRLPNDAKQRRSWLHDLTGMLMTRAGIASAQQFSPIAVPDGYEAVRGRPTLVKDKEDAAADGKQAATGS